MMGLDSELLKLIGILIAFEAPILGVAGWLWTTKNKADKNERAITDLKIQCNDERNKLELRLMTENKEQWSIITKVREWEARHEKEAAEHRLGIEQRMNQMALNIAKNEAEIKAVVSNINDIKDSLVKLNDKFDKLLTK